MLLKFINIQTALMRCSVQKHKPMAVGGIGMISTANYVARRYGVRSAMPGFIGRRLCPELVFVRPGALVSGVSLCTRLPDAGHL